MAWDPMYSGNKSNQQSVAMEMMIIIWMFYGPFVLFLLSSAPSTTPWTGLIKLPACQLPSMAYYLPIAFLHSPFNQVPKLVLLIDTANKSAIKNSIVVQTRLSHGGPVRWRRQTSRPPFTTPHLLDGVIRHLWILDRRWSFLHIHRPLDENHWTNKII